VVGDTNSREDVFVRDTVAGTTIRASVDSGGSQGNSASADSSLSGDGRYVAFYSFATNLVAGDANGQPDIFVRDTLTGTTTRVSLDTLGVEANGDSNQPSISASGRYVVFETGATNLVPDDLNGKSDIAIRAVPEVTVTSVIPDHLPIGATTSVTITGSNFLVGAIPDLGDAQTSNIVIVNENTITVDVTVPANTPAGAQDVSVGLPGTGPGPLTGAVGTCTNCATFFEVGPDTDGDGVPDNLDNCPVNSNAGQADNDGDGIGNKCDNDYVPPGCG
jgi:hypothetical protein